jgi:preprotein translocase subunit SecE
MSWLTNTRKFIAETLDELQKCKWPTRDELFHSTIVVIAAIAGVTVFVACVDFASQKIIRFLTGF